MNRDENPDGKSGGNTTEIFSKTALVVLVSYVVLLGPIAKYYDYLPEQVGSAVVLFYSPIVWLDSVIPGKPFTRYVELWVGDLH